MVNQHRTEPGLLSRASRSLGKPFKGNCGKDSYSALWVAITRIGQADSAFMERAGNLECVQKL